MLRLLTGGYGNALTALRFDPASATLKEEHTIDGLAAPTWVSAPSAGGTVYACEEWGSHPTGHGVLSAYTLHDSSLVRMNSVSSGGLWPVHCLPHDGHLYVVNFLSATLVSIPLRTDGALDDYSQKLSFKRTGPLGPAPAQEAEHPHGIALDPSGGWIVVPDMGADLLRIFKVDQGRMVEEESVRVRAGNGPRHAVFDGERARLYVVGEVGNSLSIYSVSYSPFLLTPLRLDISVLPPTPHPDQDDFSAWHAAACELSPDGRTLIVSNRSMPDSASATSTSTTPDSLAVFPVLSSDAGVGEPRFVDAGGRTPRHVEFSKDGRYLALALQDSGEVVVLSTERWEPVASCKLRKPAVVRWI